MKLLLAIVLLMISIFSSNVNGASQNIPDTPAKQEVFLGTIPTRSHGVSGKVYALDDRTIIIRELYYDGQAPDAFFWIGNTDKPGVTGTAVPDENGSMKPLKGYRNAKVKLTLPFGKTIRDIKYFGLWCRAFQENFGHIKVKIR
ncbi:hypothetical protein RDWZM_006050 [Blomia tropicalis]|uniref:DM13 domain-containing protein n=1 Tax=Blomia tropicalis TaxID=40697 RepID=A0A9Q0RLE3_BLOTA|nr:hypothetical protein BLOT_009304 [Blomia tropicalis]KAJ6220238.1 hypothetical protein RDWZM_006050 [Blomia tropicalis]